MLMIGDFGYYYLILQKFQKFIGFSKFGDYKISKLNG